MGSLARTSSLFYHRPLETDSVEQLMKPSWLQCLCLYPVVVSVVICLKPRRGRKLLQPVDKEGTCRVHANLEELGEPRAPWLTTQPGNLLELFNCSVTQTCCVWGNISCPTQGEKLYLLEVVQLPETHPWSQQLDFEEMANLHTQALLIALEARACTCVLAGCWSYEILPLCSSL